MASTDRVDIPLVLFVRLRRQQSVVPVRVWTDSLRAQWRWSLKWVVGCVTTLMADGLLACLRGVRVRFFFVRVSMCPFHTNVKNRANKSEKIVKKMSFLPQRFFDMFHKNEGTI